MFNPPVVMDAATLAAAGLTGGLPAALQNAPSVVFVFGSSYQYDRSNLYLAAFSLSDIEAGTSKWFYYKGNGQWSNSETDSAPVLSSGASGVHIGNHSVVWNSVLRRFILMHNDGDILAQFSPAPWGPWTDPVTVFSDDDTWGAKLLHRTGDQIVRSLITVYDSGGNPVDYGSDPGVSYSPNLLDKFTQNMDGSITVYYTLSTWNPYEVFLMKSTFTQIFAPPPPPPPPPSTISLSNAQLEFWDYTAQSSLTPPQAIGVSNTSGGTLSFTATPNAPWISVTPASSEFTVSVNPAGLAVGPHMSTISVASPGATNSPQTVTVTLTVSASVQIPPPTAARFVPITPCRIADTRNPNGPFGGPRLPKQTSRDFVIPSSACGIPSTALAYSLNVAVVPSGPLGYLTLWPTGQPQPLVATLNSLDGRVKSNAAIVPAGAGGAISAFVTDSTDVILDINGYFVAASNAGALAFYPLTPCRVADTRNAAGPLGGPSLAAQSTRSFPIQASSCGLPANAQAYSLNFAAVPKGPSLGFMTAWPAGQTKPLVASLNDPTGTVLANAVIVPAGTGGAVDVFTTDATDLVIDINGYFAPPGAGGLSLYTVAPCRVLNSRLPTGSPPFNMTRDVNVTGSPCGVPATAHAFVFNATVVPPGFLGYITMWPQGQTQPLAATLNAYDGAVTNNMAIVPTTTGSISVFPSNPTHLVLDIFGYFAP